MECIDNHLLYTIKTRRSIRKYTDEPLPENALRHILLAGMYSPSSRNRRPWEFILVNDPDMLKKMSGCRVGSAKMLEHAKAAIVVIGNPEVSDVWIEDCSVVMYGMHLMADYLGVGSCWIQCRLRQAEDGSSTKEYLRHLLHFPEILKWKRFFLSGCRNSILRHRTLQKNYCRNCTTTNIRSD